MFLQYSVLCELRTLSPTLGQAIRVRVNCQTYVRGYSYVHLNSSWLIQISRKHQTFIYHVTIQAWSAVYANLNILIYASNSARKQIHNHWTWGLKWPCTTRSPWISGQASSRVLEFQSSRPRLRVWLDCMLALLLPWSYWLYMNIRKTLILLSFQINSVLFLSDSKV